MLLQLGVYSRLWAAFLGCGIHTLEVPLLALRAQLRTVALKMVPAAVVTSDSGAATRLRARLGILTLVIEVVGRLKGSFVLVWGGARLSKHIRRAHREERRGHLHHGVWRRRRFALNGPLDAQRNKAGLHEAQDQPVGSQRSGVCLGWSTPQPQPEENTVRGFGEIARRTPFAGLGECTSRSLRLLSTRRCSVENCDGEYSSNLLPQITSMHEGTRTSSLSHFLCCRWFHHTEGMPRLRCAVTCGA